MPRLLTLAKPLIERFPRLATLYRSVRDQLDVSEPVQTPWGFKLAGNAAMAQGTFEREETTLVRDLLRDVDVLVNVGANVGYYCCHALEMGKEVIAFEPIQRNVRYLCQNVKANGWACEIYPIALSGNAGIMEMYGGDTGASLVKGWAGIPDTYSALVPQSTMDLVLGQRLAGRKVLVIMDVEGAEMWVLEGAAGVLASTPRPTWLIEIAVAEHQPRGVDINPRLTGTFERMFEAGYRAYTADGNQSPVTMAEVEAAQRGDLGKLRTNNFLFR